MSMMDTGGRIRYLHSVLVVVLFIVVFDTILLFLLLFLLSSFPTKKASNSNGFCDSIYLPADFFGNPIIAFENTFLILLCA